MVYRVISEERNTVPYRHVAFFFFSFAWKSIPIKEKSHIEFLYTKVRKVKGSEVHLRPDALALGEVPEIPQVPAGDGWKTVALN